MAMLFSIHGIRTEGEWQERIDPSFEAIKGFRHRKHKYGYFDFWKVGSKKQRDQEVERFADFYDEHVKDGDPAPSIIAHSFGTYIAGSALARFPAIKFNRIILCGSIIATDFDWKSCFDTNRVRAVLNERAGDDWVVTEFRSLILRGAIPNSGPSGVDGFTSIQPRLIERIYPQFQHSDHFILRAHCNRFWRPFIFDNEEFAALCARYIEGDRDAHAALEDRYLPMLTVLIRGFSPKASAEVIAERADTFLQAMAIDGVTGIYSGEALAAAKVAEFFVARREDDEQ